MTDRNDYAAREVAHWLKALPSLDISIEELVAATRLTRLFTIHDRLDAVALRKFDREGIAGTEDFRLLALLRRFESEGLTNADLVTQLGGSKSGMSNRLDRLVAGGLVRRMALPHDRRSHTNVLTKRGHDVADELLLAIADARHTMFSSLSSAQISQLSKTLADMLEVVDPNG